MSATKSIATRARLMAATGCFDVDSDEVVPSPCVGVCRMAPDNSLCEGCFRSLDEIRDWASASGAERRAIWLQLLQRAQLTPPAALREFPAP